MIVLDASAVVELLLELPRAAAMRECMRRAAGDATPHLLAPHLLDAEVPQVLRRLVLREEVRETRAQIALDDLMGLRIVRHPHAPLLRRVWELRHHASIYDALYVALAEAADAVLITGDRGQSRIPGTRARVECIPAAGSP